MALILKDRVKETSSSSGTGNITLGGAFPGYQTFNAVIASGSTVYYTIHNLTAGFDSEWEVGLGTFTSPATLARTTVLSSSNAGLTVNFTAGVSGLEVFITQPAGEAVYINQATNKVEAFGNGANTIAFTNINASNVVMVSGTISTNAANASDITNKTYVDGLFSTGISYHAPVLVEEDIALTAVYVQPNGAGNGVGATLTNSGANVALVVDGVNVSNTARILVYAQANAVENGVYTVTNPGNASAQWVLTRATDADTFGLANPNTLGQGDAFFVTDGDTGAGRTYICNTTGTITFGTSNISFAQISTSQIYAAGTGLNLSNLTFSVANTAVTAATYGDSSNVAQITVNAQGQLTSAANSAINVSTITVGTLPIARGGTGTTSTTFANLTSNVTGTLPIGNGGTGQTSYTDGQLLIGNNTGNTLTKNTLTAGTGISITNGNGSITVTNSSPSLGGDVAGPASSTDNAITRFDSTTGKIIQNSLVTVADDGAITAPQVGSMIPFYYADTASFPPAATSHGAIAHAHNPGAMYYAHGGSWVRLFDYVVPSTAGNILTSNGTTWTSSAPAASGATKAQALTFAILFGY